MNARNWSVISVLPPGTSVKRPSRVTGYPHKKDWSVVCRSILFVAFLFTACTKRETTAQTDTYSCPMHVEVVQHGPGKCPVCGMDLVKVSKNQVKQAGLMLTDSQVRLANITTRKITRKMLGQTIILNGKLTVDQERSQVVSSRVTGRVEKLFVKETGLFLRKGDPMMEIYSEQLITLQREFLLAQEQAAQFGPKESRYQQFVNAARKKLLLYGLADKQVDHLARTKTMEDRITFLAPAAGAVTEINVSEGQYVNEGTALYRVEDISSLWVEAELYPGELAVVKTGDQVEVLVSGFENSVVDARIVFLSPEVRSGSQVVIMRAAIRNSNQAFRPGMPAQVRLTHSAKESLALPSDAVIREQENTLVYVQTERNTFERRVVTVGMEGADQVAITEGLKEGEDVVVTGAYLLYSEQKLKGGPEKETTHIH